MRHRRATSPQVEPRVSTEELVDEPNRAVVAFDLRMPAEDELALSADTQLSPHLAWHFPRQADFYNQRYLTFRHADAEERPRWIASLRRLAAKLTFKYGRRLLFKSPLHTARVPLLLEAFPDARFVHLHRDPYRVYQSTRYMELEVEPFYRYQRGRPDTLEDRILRRYRLLYEAYLSDRAQIPAGRLVEVGFDALEREPMATLEHVYRGLQIPGFVAAMPALERYLASVRDYRKNVYVKLDADAAARVRQQWGFAFEAFGYRR